MRPLLAAVLVLSIWPRSARAELHQPDGALIPTPPGCSGGKPTGLLAELACVCDRPGVCNIGAPCTAPDQCDDGRHATCESRMWHRWNDNQCIPENHDGLDPVTEASLTPETYRPACGLTFKLLTRGTARFKNAFGWYNVGAAAPGPDDLHVMLDCNAAPGATVNLDVRTDPAYRGGEIGFFLLTPEAHGMGGTCAGGDCCPTVDRLRRGEGYAYFSQRARNPDQRGADSFIHLVVYDSHVTQRKFFFAWEDTFGAANNDFTDLLTSVEGIEGVDCAGGGAECDTGMPGVCAHGVRSCGGASSRCTPLYTPEAERCDGFDNDCDGTIDEGATCPEAGQFCHHGRCVRRCDAGAEFSCGVQFDCDTASGLCIEPSCATKDCEAGQVCRDGACVAECQGVVCPAGQRCFLDSCVDPCRNAACEAGKVCQGGVCVPGCNQCGGLVCAAGTSCAADGRCVDPACPATCPAGTTCKQARCQDACEGVTCPYGQSCCRGECVAPRPGDGCPAAGGAGQGAGAGGGAAGASGGAAGAGAAQGGAGASGAAGGGAAASGDGKGKASGCSATKGGTSGAFLVLVALWLARRRNLR